MNAFSHKALLVSGWQKVAWRRRVFGPISATQSASDVPEESLIDDGDGDGDRNDDGVDDGGSDGDDDGHVVMVMVTVMEMAELFTIQRENGLP